ncbi:hypothetical protein GGF32_007732 [Allomyces javanicus]|nr:hypothetical protein GGF32_007732 [Allomyces javanicus]
MSDLGDPHGYDFGTGAAPSTMSEYDRESYQYSTDDDFSDDDDTHDGDHSASDFEAESDDGNDDVPPMRVSPPLASVRARRTSVSAESMAPTAHDVHVEKVVIPKTDEQRERIQAAVSTNFLFRHLDDEQYADVIDAMAEVPVAEGETIIQQGGVGDFFYIVETGTLDVFVTRAGDDEEPTKVADYGPGGSFGELALMYNAPRAATVTATSDCVLWALDRMTFRRILLDHTARKRRMYETFLEEVPLLSSLEPYERHKIADALESVTFNDGDAVVRQGDPGDKFYLIESGDADVVKVDDHGDEHHMKPLHKGCYFGELALLSDKPRVASIIARGKLKCACMGKKAFNRLLGPVTAIMARHTQEYERYPGEEELSVTNDEGSTAAGEDEAEGEAEEAPAPEDE